MPDLADVDPVAIARAHLLGSQKVVEMLGGDDRVGTYNEPPYPCVRLTDPPGDDRALNHLIAPLVQVEVYGDPDGSQSTATLRRICYAVLQELKGIPAAQVEGRLTTEFGVVTAVGSTVGGGSSPEPTGQRRYLSTVRMWIHPAAVATP